MRCTSGNHRGILARNMAHENRKKSFVDFAVRSSHIRLCECSRYKARRRSLLVSMLTGHQLECLERSGCSTIFEFGYYLADWPAITEGPCASNKASRIKPRWSRPGQWPMCALSEQYAQNRNEYNLAIHQSAPKDNRQSLEIGRQILAGV